MYSQLEPADAGPTRPCPADNVERWPIERLIPYANNARVHSAADLDKIAASIRKCGWTMPVLADEDGVLLAGHARVAANVPRWQRFTGRDATHQASAQSCDERAGSQERDRGGSAHG